MDLYNALISGNEELPNKINKDLRIYLVMFSILNKRENILIYNYISYNKLFSDSLLAFLIIKSNFTSNLAFKEWGDFFTFIDYDIDNSPEITTMKRNCFEFNEYLQIYLEQNSNKILRDYIDFFDVVKKSVVSSDSFLMSFYVDLIFKKDYSRLFNTIFYNLAFDYNELSINTTKEMEMEINILKNCLFVVKDLNLFIKNIKNKGYVVNEGPQK